MAKQYVIQFGSGSPAVNTGLTPTFTVFNVVPGGGATTAPGITEIPTATGLYYFTYNPTGTVAFVIDGVSLLGSARYVVGSIGTIDKVDEQITDLGTSLLAQGTSLTAQGATILAGVNGQGSTLTGLLGNLSSSFGTTLTDPTTVFGYLKRIQEYNEGNSVFTKSSGAWSVASRGTTYILGPSTYPGSSTILAAKTITDTGAVITKT